MIEKYQYVENSERHVGFNRVDVPDSNGMYFDLTNDQVKQYLSYELMSSPNILRNYGNASYQAYEPYIKTTKLEKCEDIWNRTNGLEN